MTMPDQPNRPPLPPALQKLLDGIAKTLGQTVDSIDVLILSGPDSSPFVVSSSATAGPTEGTSSAQAGDLIKQLFMGPIPSPDLDSPFTPETKPRPLAGALTFINVLPPGFATHWE